MEFKLNKKLFIIVGTCLLIAGILLVIVPLVILILNPTAEMVSLATRLSIIGGILFIPGIIGLERFLGMCVVFFIGVGLVVGGVWLGLHLFMVEYIPELAIVSILLLLGGIPSILNSIFIHHWINTKVELSEEESITTQQVYQTIMVYAILLAIAIGCGLLVFLWLAW